ncbi:MAG: ABC transporter ATP-binding protein [Butyribacter sp.]|nr:ABC transporter ATP-binding protein [bacterium]MDY3853340.1 ABC transporter ATP-binding protein [Butyribacter sp.]
MIEVKHLVKRYGNHVAVNDLSFTVDTGKVVGFLGPNGAGKSTTMNMITGYIAQTEGTILVDGIDTLEEPEKAKERIGYLPEIPPLYPDLRVREYLQFIAELRKVKKSDRDMVIYEIMKKTKILDVSERLIRHLSKGYKQRVGLAATMIGEPDILILDEPTVGLDPGQIIEIRELIRELSKDHTVLLSSHIMQEISAVCDEIIIINEGKVIACDTPENLTKRMMQNNGVFLLIRGSKEEIEEGLRAIPEVTDIVYDEERQEDAVGVTVYANMSADIREDIFYAMAEKKCPVIEMRQLDTSLEDAFLALTKGGSRQFAENENYKKKGEEEE